MRGVKLTFKITHLVRCEDRTRSPKFCGGSRNIDTRYQEPTETSKQPIRTRYLGHVIGYQPIRDHYFLIRSVPTRYNWSHHFQKTVKMEKIQTLLNKGNKANSPNHIKKNEVVSEWLKNQLTRTSLFHSLCFLLCREMKFLCLTLALFGATWAKQKTLKVTVYTEGHSEESGTTDIITMRVHGASQDVERILGSDFPAGSVREITYNIDENLGNVYCIDLETNGDDWWWPRTVKVQYESKNPVYFYNTFNQKLSIDADVTPKTQSTPPVLTPKTQSTPPVLTPKTQSTPPVLTPKTQSTPPVLTPKTQSTPPVLTPKTQSTPPVLTPKTQEFEKRGREREKGERYINRKIEREREREPGEGKGVSFPTKVFDHIITCSVEVRCCVSFIVNLNHPHNITAPPVCTIIHRTVCKQVVHTSTSLHVMMKAVPVLLPCVDPSTVNAGQWAGDKKWYQFIFTCSVEVRCCVTAITNVKPNLPHNITAKPANTVIFLFTVCKQSLSLSGGVFPPGPRKHTHHTYSALQLSNLREELSRNYVNRVIRGASSNRTPCQALAGNEVTPCQSTRRSPGDSKQSVRCLRYQKHWHDSTIRMYTNHTEKKERHVTSAI
eukprot:sb/3463158/